jgi:hypothetical protein
MRYPTFSAREFPIGSGAIESTAKNLIQQRQAQAGMRWSTRGAQAVASLRALHRSGRWPTFWQSQPQTRLRLLRGGWASAPAPADAPAAAPAPAVALAPPLPGAQRIQTAGKPWWQRRAWPDRPVCPRRSA